jgi:hypothetical protein
LFCGIILAFCLWLVLHRTAQIKGESREAQITVTNQPLPYQPAQSQSIKEQQNINASIRSNVLSATAVPQVTPDVRRQKFIAS